MLRVVDIAREGLVALVVVDSALTGLDGDNVAHAILLALVNPVGGPAGDLSESTLFGAAAEEAVGPKMRAHDAQRLLLRVAEKGVLKHGPSGSDGFFEGCKFSYPHPGFTGVSSSPDAPSQFFLG